MMYDNHNPLPFYKSLNEQAHRRNYAYGEIYPLYSPCDRLLPFQLQRKHRTSSTWNAKLYDMEGTEIDITTYLPNGTGFNVVSGTQTDTIVYCPLVGWSYIIPQGRYYVRLTDGVNTWYSEVFTVINYLANYLRLEWRNIYDLPIEDGSILYESAGEPYYNVLYFAAELGKPEYTYEEEGENRDGLYFAEKCVSTKGYRFFITAPEYLCDCLRLVRLADYIRITDGYGNDYRCDTFNFTPQWQETGSIATVTIEFTTGTIVAKKVGLGFHNIGDFNNDFNNDYNIS